MQRSTIRHILLCATMLAAVPAPVSAATVFDQGPVLNGANPGASAEIGGSVGGS